MSVRDKKRKNDLKSAWKAGKKDKDDWSEICDREPSDCAEEIAKDRCKDEYTDDKELQDECKKGAKS